MAYPEVIEQIKTKAQDMKLSQIELASRSEVSTSYLSRIFSLEREASDQILMNLAAAVNLPPLDILRKANRIPADTDQDETLSRISHLYHTLKDQASKTRALEFLEFLSQQEEKHDRKGKGSK